MQNNDKVHRTVRHVGFVGTGYIADWHAKAIASVDGVRLTAVCDRILPRAQALAQRYGVPSAYASLEEMLGGERLDAVHILLQPNLHYDIARSALLAGVDVLLEKPMCVRAEECDALVQLAAERGRRLGVAHNFLFATPYEKLRTDVRAGLLGRIDQIAITWNRVLPQAIHGPFDQWMLRDPRNIVTEVGSHLVSQMLDLAGEPESLAVRAGNAITLPTGRSFYRRWQVQAERGQTAMELRMSFVPGFSEFKVHIRGSLGAATADMERNTYALERNGPRDPDFDSYEIVKRRSNSEHGQARETLRNYLLSKLKVRKLGSPYGESIARAMKAFYAPQMDERVQAAMGVRVIRCCETIAHAANLPTPTVVVAQPRTTSSQAKLLVLGGSGFIGKEVLRQLVANSESVRVMARSAASLPQGLQVECMVGDTANRNDLLRAMQGVECVLHLARPNVKSWADYQALEIEATRRVAECALEAGVKRLVYSGTIDSYYAGSRAGTITEATPLDPRIVQRNLYARAKAESEKLLLQMQRERGLPLVIVRPGIVIGRGGSPFHWGVGMWWNDSVCQMWGDGENKLPLVLVQDVARGLIAARSVPGIEGRSYNLIGEPYLSAQEYLDELDRCGAMKIQREATPILHFYLKDMMKWLVKMAVRHPEHRMPSYRDWESRTQRAYFDCSAAKRDLAWQPVASREELIELGIAVPVREYFR